MNGHQNGLQDDEGGATVDQQQHRQPSSSIRSNVLPASPGQDSSGSGSTSCAVGSTTKQQEASPSSTTSSSSSPATSATSGGTASSSSASAGSPSSFPPPMMSSRMYPASPPGIAAHTTTSTGTSTSTSTRTAPRPSNIAKFAGTGTCSGSGDSTRSSSRIPHNMDEYRAFLRNHQTVVRLVEDVLARLVLYAPSRLAHSTESDPFGGAAAATGNRLLNAESLYALLNLWTLTNDVLLCGWGDGAGMTVGTASDLLGGDDAAAASAEEDEAEKRLRKDWGEVSVYDDPNSTRLFSFLSSSVGLSSIIKTLLPNAVTNIATNPTSIIVALRTILSALECVAPAFEVLSGIPRTPIIPGPIHVQRQSLASANLTKMNTLRRIERIKFYCRLCLLVVNVGSAYQRIRRDDDDDGQSVLVPSVLCHGGMLCPGERGVECIVEEERLRRLSYVGRRTGRRTCPGGTPVVPKSRMSGGCGGGGGGWTNVSATTRLAALTAGELLHVYRPLYWTTAERNHAAHDLDALRHGGGGLAASTGARSGRMELLKSWIVSLAMDVLSHRLTLAAAGGCGGGGGGVDTPSGIIGMLKHPNNDVNTARLPPATAEELKRRKMRWMLYLLRCPVWDVMTRPVAGGLADVVGRFVPLLGRPVANYVMDLLVYWQRHHFMLEG